MTIKKFNFEDLLNKIKPSEVLKQNESDELIEPTLNNPVIELNNIEPKDQDEKLNFETIEELKKDNYNLGYQQAKEELIQDEHQRQQLFIELLTNIDQKLDKFVSNQTNYFDELSKQMTKLALVIAKKVASDALDDRYQEFLLNKIESSLSLISKQTDLTISVNSQAYELIKSHLNEFKQQFKFSSLDLEIDSKLAPNECIIDWQNGQIEIQPTKLWAEIEKLISSQ